MPVAQMPFVVVFLQHLRTRRCGLYGIWKPSHMRRVWLKNLSAEEWEKGSLKLPSETENPYTVDFFGFP